MFKLLHIHFACSMASILVLRSYLNIIISSAADLPTLLKLKMKGTDGVNIIQKVAAGNYTTFGMYLLQDESGVRVDLIKNDHRQDGAEGITEVIIQKWLTDGSTQIRTYEYLIKCLRESEMESIADDIGRRTQ